MIDRNVEGTAGSQFSTLACERYMPQLDGLRFIAATAVFLHHCAPLPLLGVVKDMGWIGVDLFLLLSSYLLSSIIRRELLASEGFSVWNFFVRRALRIWPLFFAFTLGAYFFSLQTSGLELKSIGQLLSHWLFVNNIAVAVLGYGDTLAFTSHLWTISLEEQFYCVVPFVVPVLVKLARKQRSYGPKFVIATICLLILIRFTWFCLDVRHPFIWALWFRFDSIVLGVALGSGMLDRCWLRNLPPKTGIVASLATIAIASTFPDVRNGGWEQVVLYTIVDAGLFLLLNAILADNTLVDRQVQELGLA